MDDINTNGATDNDNLEVDNTAIENVDSTQIEPAAEPSKPLSLDEAVRKAFNKHNITEDENKKITQKPVDGQRKVVSGDERVKTEDGKQIDPVTGRELQPINAPSSWTAPMREKWGAIDPQVQQFIANREKHVMETLSKTSDERRVAKEFTDIFEPHRALLSQHNVNAVAYTKDVIDFSVKLNTGTPQEKAALIHQLIMQQKPDAATLTALFSGQQVNIPQRPVAQKSDAERQAEWQSQYEEQNQVKAASAELEKFAAENEFYHDVHPYMQKVIEAGLVDGETLPELFKNAYDMAVAHNTEIQQVLAARQTASSQRQTQVAPAAKPVGSVKPSLGSGRTAPSSKQGRMTLDEALADAVNKHWR